MMFGLTLVAWFQLGEFLLCEVEEISDRGRPVAGLAGDEDGVLEMRKGGTCRTIVSCWHSQCDDEVDCGSPSLGVGLCSHTGDMRTSVADRAAFQRNVDKRAGMRASATTQRGDVQLAAAKAK